METMASLALPDVISLRVCASQVRKEGVDVPCTFVAKLYSNVLWQIAAAGMCKYRLGCNFGEHPDRCGSNNCGHTVDERQGVPEGHHACFV
jgi:hypothetical protein